MGEGTKYFLICGLAFGKQRSLPLALPLLRPVFAPQGEKEQELSDRWGEWQIAGSFRYDPLAAVGVGGDGGEQHRADVAGAGGGVADGDGGIIGGIAGAALLPAAFKQDRLYLPQHGGEGGFTQPGRNRDQFGAAALFSAWGT